MAQKYDVTGMTCSACSAHVEKAVRKVEGVQDVTVNLLTNSMQVEGAADPASVIRAVEQAGYGASVQGTKQENPASQRDERRRRREETLRAMKRRLIISFAFLIPLMYVSMGSMMGAPLPAWLTGHENAVTFGMVQLLLTLPVVYVNRSYYEKGFATLAHRSPNMDSLVAIGSAASLVYGVFAIIRMGQGLGAGDMALVERYHMDLYFESAAMILALVTLGKYLETRSKGKTGEAIEKLMDLAPKTAEVERGGTTVSVPIEQVQVGDIVCVRPGSSVPVDGVIVEGSSGLDESALTGESIPVEKTVGDTVIAASVNKAGFFKFRATKVGEDTTLAQIVRFVEDASATKAPIAKMADRIAGVFVPVVIAIAVAASVIWLIAGQTPEFALSVGIAVLVISCPCALGLATPVAIMVGTGKGAEYGVLIKSGDALERAHNITAVVMDKTGTITEGKPAVTDIMALPPMQEKDLLRLAASIENGSEHPLASAIIAAAEERGTGIRPSTEFKAWFGLGVTAKVSGREYAAGNEKMMKQRGIEIPQPVRERAAALAGEGKTPLLFADSRKLLGIVAVADTIKPTSTVAVRTLEKMGVEVTMLTGDNARTAEAIRKQLGIRRVIAEVLPDQKEAEIARLQKEGKVVAMVGDGINDAPALARADVGIAIGAGTDVAIESADVVLMKSDLRDVATAIELSKAVISNIKLSLFWAFFYNSVGIPLAAGLLYPMWHLKLSPMFGAAAMSLSSVCVVTNALRLRRFRPRFAQETESEPTEQPAGVCETPAAAPETNTTNIKEESSVKTITLNIEGMMCAHCVAHVTKALEGVEGVKPAVSLENRNAVCEVPEGVTAEMLSAAVTEAGYEVTGMKEG